jgi:hypothetical protein
MSVLLATSVSVFYNLPPCLSTPLFLQVNWVFLVKHSHEMAGSGLRVFRGWFGGVHVHSSSIKLVLLSLTGNLWNQFFHFSRLEKLGRGYELQPASDLLQRPSSWWVSHNI